MVRRLTGLAVILFPPLVASAQVETDAIVAVREATVYAAPQLNAPDTAALSKGTRVRVHHEEVGGWLAIQPPNGSITWVNHRFLEFTEGSLSSATIAAGDSGAEVEAGKYGVNAPLGVRRTKLPKDLAVTVMAPKVRWDQDNSTWYPIWSPHGDYRYIRKDMVQPVSQPLGNEIVRAGATMPLQPTLAESVEPFRVVKPVSTSNHPLWAQAEAADKSGEWDKSERLFFQLAGEMNKAGGDPDVANACYAKIHAMRERRRETSAKTTEKTSSLAPATTFEDSVRIRNTERTSTAATNTPRDTKENWYGPGELVRSVGQYKGQTIYALENEPGRVINYAVAGTGVDLSTQTRRNVTVSAKVIEADYSNGKALVEVISVVGR